MATVSDRRFYVYAYLRVDGTPYYIGKGVGRRAWNRHVRRGKSSWKPPHNDRIKVIASGLTETEAFEMEEALISVLGRKDKGTGCLVNMTDGGEGKSGWVPSVETRQKISESRTGQVGWQKTPEQCLQISRRLKGVRKSETHVEAMRQSQLGKRQSAETVNKRRRAVAAGTAARFGIELETWLSMSPAEKESVRRRFVVSTRTREAAARCGVPIEEWLQLSVGERRNLGKLAKIR